MTQPATEAAALILFRSSRSSMFLPQNTLYRPPTSNAPAKMLQMHICKYNTRNNQMKVQYYETRTRTYCTNLPRLTASPMMKEDTRMVKMKVSGMDMARNTGPLLAIVHICM